MPGRTGGLWYTPVPHILALRVPLTCGTRAYHMTGPKRASMKSIEFTPNIRFRVKIKFMGVENLLKLTTSANESVAV